MDSKVYPDLQKMCRLCLKENAGTICIFSKEKNSDKYSTLSVPMRIMTCAALEVQESDDFPAKICSECRLQLEKSYYFRKMSQASDTKLRKHLRLVGMGKASKVFAKKEEDDDDDELEFQNSIDFIKEHENAVKQKEKLKFDSMLNEMKLQNEQDLKKIKDNLRLQCREELTPEIIKQITPEIKEQLRNELRLEVENELEENLRKEISESCVAEAKEALRDEIREECRQLEIRCLLDDLQTYLNNKKSHYDSTFSMKDIVGVKRSNSPVIDKHPSAKRKCVVQNSVKAASTPILMELEQHSKNVEKGENINLDEKIIGNENDLPANDEECDSEGNFLIYEADDAEFEIQQKPIDCKGEYSNNVIAAEEYEEDYVDSNSATYEKINVENIEASNEESGGATTTTSYRIDNENGEIQFLKKSDESLDEENIDENNEDIMVINFPEGLDNEFVEEMKYVKEKNNSTSKSKKSPGKKAKTSTVTRTTSTLETTVLTKTYVNPMQRCTDTPKIFRCNDCPMVFSTKPSLERHTRTHIKIEKTGITYQCPECRIVVSCSSALRRHMYVHCDEKPFPCSICGKSFVQKEILKRHMQTHTGIKPHQCPHCDRSFAQRINLTQHINRTHLEEPRIQQHSCHLCPKRFNHASGLSRHLASHSGVAFQCSECDRTFGDRSSIKRHILNMHTNIKTQKTDPQSKTP